MLQILLATYCMSRQFAISKMTHIESPGMDTNFVAWGPGLPSM